MRGKLNMQQRAKSDMDIIAACEIELNDKMSDKKKEKVRLTGDINILNERIKMAGDDDKADYSYRVTQLEKSVKNLDTLTDAFRKILSELNDLYCIVQCFYEFKQYRFIVKKIPWDKLPDLIYDLAHIEDFYKVVLSLVEDFNGKMIKLRSADAMDGYLKAHPRESILDR